MAAVRRRARRGRPRPCEGGRACGRSRAVFTARESGPGKGGRCSVLGDRRPDSAGGRQGRPGDEGSWEGSRSGGGSKEFGGGGAHLRPLRTGRGGQAGRRADESRPACERDVGTPRAQHAAHRKCALTARRLLYSTVCTAQLSPGLTESPLAFRPAQGPLPHSCGGGGRDRPRLRVWRWALSCKGAHPSQILEGLLVRPLPPWF